MSAAGQAQVGYWNPDPVEGHHHYQYHYRCQYEYCYHCLRLGLMLNITCQEFGNVEL